MRYRDEARARLASGPPDARFHDAGRRRWRDRVAHLARCLDELGPADRTLGPILDLAFRALLPLIDPGWWRAHPQARLNAGARRLLRGIDKRRRRVARRGWARTGLDRLLLQACGAAAIYARHGDGPALAEALRLIDVLDQALAGAGAGGGGPPVTGTERRTAPGRFPVAPGGRKPAAGSLPSPRRGAADAAPGKEDDV